MNWTTGTTTLLAPAKTEEMDNFLRALARVEREVFNALVVPFDLIREPSPIPTAQRIVMDAAVAEAKLRGIQIHVNTMLDGMNFPVRVHRKRKWMSEAYHRRIQKKRNKRFGVGPAAFFINQGRLAGMLSNLAQP